MGGLRTESKPTMIFDVQSGVKNDPDHDLLACFQSGQEGVDWDSKTEYSLLGSSHR